jgi:protein-S-isoprenylcysteine O-methyltransferase Ste14
MGLPRRVSAFLGTAVFLLLAPGFVAGAVPWWISRWRWQPPFFGFKGFRVVGALLIAAGIPIVLDSFVRFAAAGGTPAPVFPTQHLVVKGFYRYMRNPMYVGVVLVILGQGLLLGNVHILVYVLIPWLAAHVFVLTYEEPTMRRTFGAEFESYAAQVPRWVPRLRPWRS